MRNNSRAATLALCTLLLSSCGGDNNPAGPGGGGSGSGLPEPNPASVTVATDPGRMSTARIPITGGSLQATGSDGTVYTLTVPADALISDTTITMTPISDVSGLAVTGGRFAGVQLEPEGLRFLQPLSLRIAPPEGAHQEAVALSYHGNGSEVHRVPLTPDPDLLEIHLMHFSGNLIYLGNNTYILPLNNIIPTDAEDRIESELQQILHEERQRQLRGEEPDPTLGEKVAAGLREYYTEVVQPTLGRMQTDCSYSRTALPRALSWVRQVQLWSLGEGFSAEIETITGAMINSLRNCFDEGKKDCIDTSDPVLMNELVGITRQLELLGALDDAHNALNPEFWCSKGWSGTTSRTRRLGGSVTDVILGDVQWEIDSAETHPGIVTTYQIKRGTIHWEQKGTDEFGCTYQGGPLSFDLTPADGKMIVDEINHTYQATGIASHFAIVTVTCPPTQPPGGTADVSVGDWLITPALPLAADAKKLSGTWDYPTPDNTYVWDFAR
jgi:hypothetical protein